MTSVCFARCGTGRQRVILHLLNVHVVQVVLNKLNSGVEVGLVELVGDVPSQRPVLPPLLHRAVEKGNSVQHRLPLHHVTHIQQVLVNA